MATGIEQGGWITLDLDQRTAVINGKNDLYQGDALANAIQIRLTKSGEVANLTGCVAEGEMVRSDGSRVPCDGNVKSDEVRIELNEHCYVYAGPYTLSVRLRAGAGQWRTILRINGEVQESGDGPMVDVTESLVDVNAVLALYRDMMEVKEAANAAATAASGAATAANTAATKATNAATAASGAASSATSATENANAAALAANGAAEAANEAAGKAAAVASKSPYIGTNGNWYVYDVNAKAYVDSGNSAQGTGNVSSVNGVWPDGDGNVPLTPADLGAVSVASVEENLLVNSDFRADHVVNQRGRDIYSGAAQYTISRWKTTNAFTSVTLKDEGILIENTTSGSAGYLAQPLYSTEKMLGKEYTFAVCLADGRVLAASGRLPEALPTENQSALQIMDGDLSIGGLLVTAGGIMARVWSNSNENSRTFRWAKLVRGAFAANEITSAEQDESQEMLKCLQTAVQLRGDLCRAYVTTANILFFVVPIFNALGLSGGVTPTISGTFVLKTISGAAQSGFTFEINSIAPQGIGIKATKTGHGLTDGYLGTDGLVVITCDK